MLFDPAQLPYRDLLGIFLEIHDPNLAECPVILYHDESQREAAAQVLLQAGPSMASK